jgi:acetoin utilization deacetylase AcuC-like enzyme
MEDAVKIAPSNSVLVSDIAFEKHVTGFGHPEQPARNKAVLKALDNAGISDKFRKVEPRPCKDSDILRCHSGKYLNTVKADVKAGETQLSTGDTAICPASLDIGRLAAGATLAAVDEVLTGKASNAFCVVRPPGHHATPDKGMGFCLFNNIAIAARYAQKKYGIGKILIVDWDVHHGNGTQDVFYEDETVFFFSTHQSPWYPGTGEREETGKGKGLGSTLNRPCPAGSGRDKIVENAFGQDLLTLMNGFRPELILISAGFDSRIGDPLGQFRLVDEDFTSLTGVVLDLAKEYADGKVVSVLEGGYDLNGLGKASVSHARKLLSI